MLQARDLTLLVFAGGKASRMGGLNKALVSYAGTSMIEHVLAYFAGRVGAVLVSANRDADRFGEMGLTAFADVREGFPGPMAALEALHVRGLLRTPWLLTAPCDVPDIPEGLCGALLEAQAQHPQARAFAAFNDGRPQNAFMLLRADALSDAGVFLDEGERKVGFWLRRIGARFIEVEGVFENFNTTEELERAERRRAASTSRR